MDNDLHLRVTASKCKYLGRLVSWGLHSKAEIASETVESTKLQ